MTVWPVKSSRTSVKMSSTALMRGSHAQVTVSGVRTRKNVIRPTWIQKQPRPGPRSASSGSPLYSGGSERRAHAGADVATRGRGMALVA